MVLQNSNNQSFSNNSDGFSLGGGISTRTLTLSGADLSILLSSVTSGDILQYNGTNWVNVEGSTLGTGSVTSITAGNGLSGGTITNSGTLSVLLNGTASGLSVGSNGLNVNLTNLPSAGTLSGTNSITVGQNGSSVNTTLSSLTSFINSAISATAPIVNTNGTISLNYDGLTLVTDSGTLAVGTISGNQISGGTLTSTQITGLNTPVNSSDAVNKAYVDGIAAGIDAKQSVVVATVGTNIALDGSVTTLDGVTLSTGERVLVKDQTDPTQNGIYIVNTSGPWTRSTDMATGENAEANFVFVAEGTANAGKGFVVYNSPAIVGTDDVLFTQFSEVGAYGALVNGGLTLDAGTPADFTIDFSNLTSLGTLGTGSKILISNNGTLPTYTTVSTLANFITGGSALGAAVTTGSTASALTYNTGTFTLNVDGTSVKNSSNGLSVVADGATITNTPSGIAVISAVNGGLANTPGGVTLDVSNLNSASTITSIDTLPIYDAIGGTTVSVTLGSLATYVGSNAIFGTGAITVTGGTVALVTDNEFSQTGGTLSLGNITPTSITTSGTIAGGALSGSSLNVSGNGTFGGNVNITGTVSASNLTGTNTGDQTITLTGDVTGSGTGSFTTTLATVNANVGTFTALTVNAKGLVTAATNLVATGDATGTASGTAINLTLANSGVTPGTYSTVVVNSKGLVTYGTSADLQWVDVTGTMQQMSANIGYMSDNAAQITFVLPTNANFGDIIPLVGFGAGGWEITQNAGQTIHFGNRNTTTGTSGGLISNNRFDSVELFCAVANTDFVIRNSVGNISVI